MMARQADKGRRAKTRGVSLSPREAALVDEFQSLTGQGLTEQVRQSLLPKLSAAVALLKDMRDAEMEIGSPLVAEQVVYAETADDRRRLREDTLDTQEASADAVAAR
jgi:hypothetical protein